MPARGEMVMARKHRSDLHRKQWAKNIALLALLLTFIVVVYFVALVRMGGG